MFKTIGLVCALLALSTLSSYVHAQVDCTPLDPRAAIDKKRSAEITASADTALKIAKASGTIKGSAETKILAVPEGVGADQHTLLQMRSIYIFCGMVANAKDLNTSQKFSLYKELLSIYQNVETRKVPPAAKSQEAGAPNSRPTVEPRGARQVAASDLEAVDLRRAGFFQPVCVIPPGTRVSSCYETHDACATDNPNGYWFCKPRPKSMACYRMRPEKDVAPKGVVCYTNKSDCTENAEVWKKYASSECKTFATED